MTRLYTLAFSLLTLLLIAFSYLAVIFPSKPLNAESFYTYVPIPEGASVKTVIQELKARNIMSAYQAPLFYGYIRYKGLQKGIQAGEYVLPMNITPAQLLQKFNRGDVIVHAFTITEGMTFAQMMRAMQFHPAIKKTLWGKSEQEMMNLLGEQGMVAEGLFFPDTYYFKGNTTDKTLLLRARKTMINKLDDAWQKRDLNIVLKTPYEALILASIIEKETGSDQERERISGVFQRRLLKNMRLQADPTVVYGLKNMDNGQITKAHLQAADNLYNTYRHGGLPPGPIALPSLRSIIAALHPDKSEALYFVARGDGTHVFSNTLVEHNRAVAQYLQRMSNHEPPKDP